MSSQTELNENATKFILYFCGFVQSDPTVYDNIGLTNVCQIDYDGLGNLYIVTWYITSYLAPSMPTLMSYTLADVKDWYDNFYVIPANLATWQSNPLSSTQIAALRTDSSMIGYLIFNTTLQKYQRFNGSTWTNLW
jgi:hypothetical protein